MALSSVINRYFEIKKKSVPRFSVRRLARDVGVSATFMSQILRGKKPLPYAMVDDLARALDIDSEAVARLKQEYIPEELRSPSGEALSDWLPGEKKEFSLLRQWFYVAILEYTQCLDADLAAEKIALRFGLSAETVRVVLRDLEAMGAIEMTASGKLKKKKQFLRLAGATSKAEIRNFHSQMLKRASETMLQDTSERAFSRRQISGITVTATPERIQVARQMLADSLHEIAAYLTAEPGTEVYHVAGQLFPLMKD